MKLNKSGFVAIIGRPNVGKSTFLNLIIATKIAIVTNKPQTTRNAIKGIYNDDRGQLVFMDTPGIHKNRHELGNRLNNIAWGSLKSADRILWFMPANEFIGDFAFKIRDYFLEKRKKLLAILTIVITKSDTVTPAALVAKIEAIKKFIKIDLPMIAISAQTNHNIEQLKSDIFENMPVGEKYYGEDQLTDVNNKFIAQEIIRETIIEKTREEIPYSVAIEINTFSNEEDYLFVEANIIVERDSQKAIIIGKGGTNVKSIGIDSRMKLTAFFEKKTTLKLFVKVAKNWRNNESKLNQFGY